MRLAVETVTRRTTFESDQARTDTGSFETYEIGSSDGL